MNDFNRAWGGASRFEIESIADDKGVSYAKAKGLNGETFDRVLRVQPHGFHSSPPAGSHALGIGLGADRDTLMLLGGEHPDHKPKGLPTGATALYNADGTILKMVGKNTSWDMQGNLTLTLKSITFKAGGETLTFDASGLKHNGVNIGKDHVHLPGSGTTGPPQP